MPPATAPGKLRESGRSGESLDPRDTGKGYFIIFFIIHGARTKRLGNGKTGMNWCHPAAIARTGLRVKLPCSSLWDEPRTNGLKQAHGNACVCVVAERESALISIDFYIN